MVPLRYAYGPLSTMPQVSGYMTDIESEMLPCNEVITIIPNTLAHLELKVVFNMHWVCFSPNIRHSFMSSPLFELCISIVRHKDIVSLHRCTTGVQEYNVISIVCHKDIVSLHRCTTGVQEYNVISIVCHKDIVSLHRCTTGVQQYRQITITTATHSDT